MCSDVHFNARSTRCGTKSVNVSRHRRESRARAHQLQCNNLTILTHDVQLIASNSCSYNYIFKVLFTTPSWYLFSIGFGHVSIFRWYLAPLRIPVRRNTILTVFTVYNWNRVMYGAITLIRSVSQINYTRTKIGKSSDATSRWRNQRFQLWCDQFSFAMTDGIQYCSFSSAYQYA